MKLERTAYVACRHFMEQNNNLHIENSCVTQDSYTIVKVMKILVLVIVFYSFLTFISCKCNWTGILHRVCEVFKKDNTIFSDQLLSFYTYNNGSVILIECSVMTLLFFNKIEAVFYFMLRMFC